MGNTENHDVIVHMQQMDITLPQLKEMSDANDLITEPDYQRKYVYDDIRASLLIESILIGIPIPIIYLCEEDEGVFSVVDGQQRIMSFVRYLKNDFSLTGLTKLTDLNAKFYRDLDKVIQRRLNSKSLKAIIISRDSQELKYEIFSRLNLGSVKLKDQELRNCIYRGNFNNMLKEIASEGEILKVLFHDTNQRHAYEERILRFFALRNYPAMRGTYKDMMNGYMEKHQDDDASSIEKAKSEYFALIDTIKQVLGVDVFFSMTGSVRKKFNGAIYDSIIIPFSYFSKKDLIENSDQIRNAINNLKSTDAEYQNNVYVGTNAGARVQGRIIRVMNIVNEILKSQKVGETKRFYSRDVKEKLFHDGYRCAMCGNMILSIDDCEVDHIIPFDCGGPTNIENAQLLHRHCNRSKKNKSEYLATIEN